MSTSPSDSPSRSSPTDYIRNAVFSRTGGPSAATSPDSPATASDLLLGAYDPARLHPLAEFGDKLDYLLLEDDKTSEVPGAGTPLPSRGWSDDLCYGTGTMYLGGALNLFQITAFATSPLLWASLFSLSPLSPYRDIAHVPLLPTSATLIVFLRHMLTLVYQGLALGGIWGLREGASRPLAVSNNRLRINSILNSVTRRGTFIGNSAGVLGPSFSRRIALQFIFP